MDKASYKYVNMETNDEYIYCSIEFTKGGKTYYYRTEDQSLMKGDFVIVPAGDNNVLIGTIISIEIHFEDSLPRPLDETKTIIRKANEVDIQKMKHRHEKNDEKEKWRNIRRYLIDIDTFQKRRIAFQFEATQFLMDDIGSVFFKAKAFAELGEDIGFTNDESRMFVYEAICEAYDYIEHVASGEDPQDSAEKLANEIIDADGHQSYIDYEQLSVIPLEILPENLIEQILIYFDEKSYKLN